LNCSKPDIRINMVPFPPIATLVFALYSRKSFRSTKGFCSPQEVYGMRLVFFLRRVSTCFTCAPFSPFMGRFFNHLFSSMSSFKKRLWIQSRC
jgi:hypothetical protein